MRALVFWGAIAVVVFWVLLSIEHGWHIGRSIKNTIKEFFRGNRSERENAENE